MSVCLKDHKTLFDSNNNPKWSKNSHPDYTFTLEGGLDYDECRIYNNIHNLYKDRNQIATISKSILRKPFNYDYTHMRVTDEILTFTTKNKMSIKEIVFNGTGRKITLDNGNTVEELYNRFIKSKNFKFIIDEIDVMNFETREKEKTEFYILTILNHGLITHYTCILGDRKITLYLKNKILKCIEDCESFVDNNDKLSEDITEYKLYPSGNIKRKRVKSNNDEISRQYYEDGTDPESLKSQSLYPNDFYKSKYFEYSVRNLKLNFGKEIIKSKKTIDEAISIEKQLEIAKLKALIINVVNSSNSLEFLKMIKERVE